MQFSLKHLISLMVVAAVGVSIYLEFKAVQEVQAQTVEIRSQRELLSGKKAMAEQQNEAMLAANQELEEQVEKCESVRESAKRIFVETASAESEVFPIANTLSVREVPLIDEGSAFHKRFRVSVPVDDSIQIRFRFSGERGGPDVPIEDDFELVQKTKFVLSSGLSEIDVRMSKASKKDNVSPPPAFNVLVDGKLVFETTFTHSETSGGSLRNYDFSKQKDYRLEDTEKYPQLVYFCHSPGKTTINLMLEPVKSKRTDDE